MDESHRLHLRKNLEHVGYEFSTFIGALFLGMDPPPRISIDVPELVFSPQTARLAIVESKVLHARGIAEFLLNVKKGKALRASDYVPRFKADEFAAIDALRKKANDQIAHISSARVTDDEAQSGMGANDKSWHPADFLPLCGNMLRFVNDLLASDNDIPDTLHTVNLIMIKGGLGLLIEQIEALPPVVSRKPERPKPPRIIALTPSFQGLPRPGFTN